MAIRTHHLVCFDCTKEFNFAHDKEADCSVCVFNKACKLAGKPITSSWCNCETTDDSLINNTPESAT